MTTVLSLEDEIATYLQSQGSAISTVLNFNGSGTVNLFTTFLPDAPDLAVAILPRPGVAPVMTLTGLSAAESKIDRPGFQVRVRSGMNGYTAGNALIQSIFKALQGITETVINGSPNALFHLISAMQSPAYIGTEPIRQRHQWSQNWNVIWENPAR